MQIRYHYFDASGTMRGPLWLSQMRELFAVGRLSKKTEVCPVGEKEWGVLENFPEITAPECSLQQAMEYAGTCDPKKAYERRMWIWLAVLLTLYIVYAVVTFR